MSHEQDIPEVRIRTRTYVMGFVGSVTLTLCAYLLVSRQQFSDTTTMAVVGGLALLQFVIQLLCFLHVGHETKPRWKLFVFWSMISIVAIVVIGSIWIMNNLNYHMMPQSELQEYMKRHEGI